MGLSMKWSQTGLVSHRLARLHADGRRMLLSQTPISLRGRDGVR